MHKTPTVDDHQPRQGYLLLADISGYTAFLTSTELEHAHEIIQELAALIRERLAPPMRFVKREGDAVFCYAGAGTFREGERLVELIESCYFDFSNRLLDMERATTCRCNACGAIGSLGVKFVAHYGSYVVERDAGREDLAGPDVILVHRLLKNSVSESDGPQAYAFFTEACMKRLPPSFALPHHSETYESFGETRGGVHDLDPVLNAMREERHLYISADDADVESTYDLPLFPCECLAIRRRSDRTTAVGLPAVRQGPRRSQAERVGSQRSRRQDALRSRPRAGLGHPRVHRLATFCVHHQSDNHAGRRRFREASSGDRDR